MIKVNIALPIMVNPTNFLQVA